MTTPEGAADVSYARWYVPLLIAFVIAFLWFTAFLYRRVQDQEKIDDLRNARPPSPKPSYLFTQEGQRICDAELELRAAGIRRFAARTGRLPETLIECDADTPGLGDLYVWCKTSPAHAWLVQAVDAALAEPWWTRTPAGQPPAALDHLSLPIVYLPRVPSLVGHPLAWRPSDRGFSNHVRAFLEANGGVPPPTTQPFLLGSLFLREISHQGERYQQETDEFRRGLQGQIDELTARHDRMGALLWAGVGVILGLGLLTAVLWCGRRAFWRPAAASIAYVIWLTMLFGTWRPGGRGTITCYITVNLPSKSDTISRVERLRLLDEAVARGEITPEVAAVARQHIQALPK